MAWVGYVEVFWNKDHGMAGSVVIALVGLWLPALVNLAGLRSIAAFQVVTTVLKFVPLLLIATIGLFFMSRANFGEFNASGGSAWSAISAAGAIALFSYLGIETASVAAGRVRDPERNVGRATVLGTLACAVVYLLGHAGGVRHRAARGAARLDGAVHRLRERDLRGTWAGQTVGVGRGGLRVRRAGRAGP